ncbi:UvrD-helicase domain-containing protein|uniref:DNA 3'-5' helicase n=1 Tax=Dendrosporobacter quercicolus TaxID=146817 RepID=A0A1G9YAF9_9FIRM|nr:UvrD-helicase domain-containing protein [Dendrosporobacter quercicolus]NSL47588.1 UvrD-helicase domain-containing protein [Dendrosporobacter quercicolus DSM 1736]SDN06078.1 TIGR00375 family protein [Dendrosporobacter quercicolus]
MFIADFHIHSKYSRATSKECVAEVLDFWARRKGIQVLGTGDFTHPAWREELKEKLIPAGEGLYALKAEFRREGKVAGTAFTPQFIVSGEISSIYKKNGRVRKVHNLILLPGLEQAEFISRKLEAVGNLRSDGRPILGLDSRDLLEIVLESCPEAMFIPAHIWTPHFSLYGAYSGFDAIEECFEDLTGYIYALETGLSSDPAMNWRISALDKFTLVSNSDAHSPANLAREANIFNTGLSYFGMLQALKNRSTTEFYGTLEFFPEEGKYHYDGHRVCKVCWKPEMTRAAGGLCPVCGGKLTVGVLHRVEALADREEGFIPPAAKPFERIVPLVEIIASSIGATAASRRVRQKYEQLLQILGPELFILREAQLADIELAAGSCITEGIRRLRCGKVAIQPGFDGEYGKVKVLDKSEIELFSGQLCFLRDELVSDSGTAGKEPSGPAAVTGAAVQAAKQVRETDGDAGLAEGAEKAPQAVPASLPYGLNKEQWEAVSASAPAIAVVAGPGTGKTKTLVCRIAYLIEQCGIHPSQISAVTFTNKAAQEMRSRLEGHFGNKRTAGAMTIGTFHSICLQRLSQWRGKETITIIDEQQARSMIGEIVKSMKLEFPLRDALKAISLLKNGAPPAGNESNAVSTALLYDAYCSQLKRYGVMDYDDILLEVLQRLEGGPAGVLSDRSGEKCCSYLLVDEFQDINEIQYRLIKQWGRNCESIFIIGDPDQSIYGFRGSDFRYFAKFTEEFPGSRQVRLTQNYRSTPEIIAAAQAVIAKKAAGDETRLLNPTRESGVKVRLIASNDEFAEAIFVAKEINRMVGGIDMLDAQIRAHKARPAGQSRGFADIAILYRTNRQAEVLEQCLLKEGIPYSVAGRDDFLSDKPVREAMAFFKFLLNPGDILSLLECFKAKSIAAAELSLKIIERYAAGRKSITALEKLLTELPSPINQPGVFPAFIEMLGRYKPVIRKERPAGIIDSWISDNNLSGIKSMELLLHTAVTHQDMSSFIQNFVLGRESDIVRSSGKVYSTDAVSLMTVHAAKGLEFPVTFICGVNDGLMPLKNSVLNFDFAEERRLFYVGVTRARDELVLMTSRTPSPFIVELPGGLLMVENAGKQRPAPRYKQDSLFDSLPALH